MKKVLLYILSLIATTGLVGCRDDYDNRETLIPSLTAHYLRPSQTDFSYYAAFGFSENFTIESLMTPWHFSNTADWIALTPMSGEATSDVTLDVEENLDANSGRTAIFYLESSDADWQYSRAMSVTQGAATPSLSIDNTSLTFSGAASVQTVNITANCSWEAACSESWVTITPDVSTGTLSIAVTSNPQTTYRSATVYISFGSNKSAYVRLTQLTAAVTSSDATLDFYNTASAYDITIQAETDWTATVSDSWISVNPTYGQAGSTKATIEVAPNTSVTSRTGYVYIKTGNSQRLQIKITQKGIYLEADSKIEFASVEESKTLSVSSNTSWAVTDKPDWVTLSKVSGEGSTDITVTATDNPNTTSRSGYITLSQPGLSLQCQVYVTQSGKTFTPGVSLLEFSDKAGQLSFNIISDASWTSTQSANWFTATPTAGKGDAQVTVTAEANNTTYERTGIINYAYIDRTAKVNVHQLAKYMTIDNKSFVFDSRGGTHTIELSTNDDWTAEIEQSVSWLKLSKTSGSGNATITLTADDNPSVNARTAVVVINTEYSQGVRILVSQQPRKLSVSAESVTFFASGGTSEPITIETNGTYEIKSDASWFTVNKSSENTFTVTATKNTSSEMRRGKITISLTDLKEGSFSLELNIIQAGEGGSFIIDGYPSDSDWNSVSKGSLSVTINGYTSDSNWDNSLGGGLTINITGFSADQNWNLTTND